MVDPTCIACRANRGELVPPGGVIYEGDGWRAEHMLTPAVLPGWLILKPLRHVESLAALTPDEAAALGPLLRQLTAALEAVTEAERVYTVLLAEEVAHVHIHLIPRRADLPVRARGPAIFNLPRTASAAACERVALAVADRLRAHREASV